MTEKGQGYKLRAFDNAIQALRTAKALLCLMVGAAAAFGYILADPRLTTGLLLSGTGVFTLACGAATFNSIQEIELDRQYKRTRNRPLVTGRLSVPTAKRIGAAACLLGILMLLGSGDSLLPAALGILALALYNLVYTPLKQRTEFALFPGGIAGALPPYIGWISAGGSLTHPLIWGVMALLFLWQPPHFFLILLEYASEYREHRTFRNLVTLFPVIKVKRIIAVWLLAFISTVIFLAALPGLVAQPPRLLLITAAPLFTAAFLYKLFFIPAPRYKGLFISLNGFMLSIMFLLAISSILNPMS